MCIWRIIKRLGIQRNWKNVDEALPEKRTDF
jgi:hypothetical protein